MAASKKHRYRLILLFIIYLVLLGYFLFFSEGMGRQRNDAEFRYNLVLFREIKRFIYHVDILGIKAVLINILGNIVVFMPFGYFIPRISNKKVGVFTTVLFSFEFSLLIEIMQLISRKGTFDVDDLLLNTIGGFLGYIVYFIIHKIIQKSYEKSGRQRNDIQENLSGSKKKTQ